MEWWKLFSGTFVLIFLAELGDKTQLAALAKTADSPDNSAAKWIVFLGASLALVASTFIAVFLGGALKALIPDERYIKVAAAALFLVFGILILRETLPTFWSGTKEPAAPAAVLSVPAHPGLAGRLALKAAMDFEAAAGDRYRRLAGAADPQLAALLNSLANEEDSHLSRLRDLPASIDKNALDLEAVPAVPGAATPEAGMPDRTAILADLIHYEEATAAFYRDLARRSLIPSLKTIFGSLADEEGDHARRLIAMTDRKPEGAA